MTERSWVSELILITVLGLFAIGCMAMLVTAARLLPGGSATAAGAKASTARSSPTASPNAVTAQAVAVSTRLALTPRPTTPAATATSAPTATPSIEEVKKAYTPVDGQTLFQQSDLYKGKKVIVTGTVFFKRPDGESTWVQIVTADRVFIDASIRGEIAKIETNQKVKVYGTGAGITTIVANDKKEYQQPFINPADFIDAVP